MRDALAFLGLLGTLGCLILFLIGMIFPKKVFLGIDTQRSKVAKVYLLGTLAFFVFMVISIPPSSKKAKSDQDVNVEAIKSGTTEDMSGIDDKEKLAEVKPSEIIQTSSLHTDSAVSPEQTAKKIQSIKASLLDVSKSLSISSLSDDTGDQYRLTMIYAPDKIRNMPWLINSSGDILNRIGAKIKANSLPINSVTLQVDAPTRDKYGNTGYSEAMTLKLDQETIQRANWKALSALETLEISQADFKDIGMMGAIEYCMEKSRFAEAPDFCSLK